jgi:hypothetical protein
MLARRTVNPAVRTARARRDPTVSYVPGWAQGPRPGAANDVTHSSRVEGSAAAAVDRFVDRAICATSALRAIGGTAP